MKKKMEFLIRKNKGKNLIFDFINEVSQITQQNIDLSNFLSLEESDIIIEKYYEDFRKYYDEKKNLFNKKVRIEEFKILDPILRDFFNEISDEYVLYITKNSEFCGIIKLKPETISSKIWELIEYDGDSLNIYSLKNDNGVLIDYFEDFENGIHNNYIEISVWGSEWSKLVMGNVPD